MSSPPQNNLSILPVICMAGGRGPGEPNFKRSNQISIDKFKFSRTFFFISEDGFTRIYVTKGKIRQSILLFHGDFNKLKH